MNYYFDVTNEQIKGRPNLRLYTGNVQTYTFSFGFDEHWQGLLKFVTFFKNDESYIIQVINNMVCVPYELLMKPGTCSFGVYGTNGEDDIKRISSNILEFEVEKGIYSEWLAPKVPTPDVWETLFKNSIPKIIGGYWYLYNPEENRYVKTTTRAEGLTPIKGTDYFTEEDKAEFVSNIENTLLQEIEICLDNIIVIQNELIGGDNK